MVGYLRLPYLRGISASFHFIITRISVPDRRIIAENSLFDLFKGFVLLISLIYFIWLVQHNRKKKVMNADLRKHHLHQCKWRWQSCQQCHTPDTRAHLSCPLCLWCIKSSPIKVQGSKSQSVSMTDKCVIFLSCERMLPPTKIKEPLPSSFHKQ